MPEKSPETLPVSVSDLDKILATFSETKILFFSPSGKLLPPKSDDDQTIKYDKAAVLAVKVRSLTDDEIASVDEITAAVVPPLKKVTQTSGALPLSTTSEELDVYDPAYQKKAREARRQRRDKLVILGMVEPAITGADDSEKLAFIHKKFPKRFLDLIAREIDAISGGPLPALELANFG
jgi:hypothetical protein